MTEKKLFELIGNSLEVDSISIDDSMETVKSWDSLSHLDILVSIDKETEGKASKIKNLSVSLSVKQIRDTLRDGGLLIE